MGLPASGFSLKLWLWTNTETRGKKSKKVFERIAEGLKQKIFYG